MFLDGAVAIIIELNIMMKINVNIMKIDMIIND